MSKEVKNEIRKAVLSRRNQMPEADRKLASLKMTDRILGHQWYYKASSLLIFASYGSEIDTKELIEEALKAGKHVYLPKVEGEDMEFYEIYSLRELQKGYKQIPEPDSTSKRYTYDEENAGQTLMLMPGVAFDAYKNRIGYGKGFYDRYLSDKPKLQLRTIAVGFHCQMTDEIPCEENDIRPYQVILF